MYKYDSISYCSVHLRRRTRLKMLQCRVLQSCWTCVPFVTRGSMLLCQKRLRMQGHRSSSDHYTPLVFMFAVRSKEVHTTRMHLTRPIEWSSSKHFDYWEAVSSRSHPFVLSLDIPYSCLQLRNGNCLRFAHKHHRYLMHSFSNNIRFS